MRVLESGATQSYNMGKNKKHKLRKTKEASESSDEGSVPACNHINMAVNVASMKKGLVKQNYGECASCANEQGKNTERVVPESGPDSLSSPDEPLLQYDVEPTLWVCLQCGNQGCDRNSRDKHALKHYETPRSSCHCLVINTTSWSAWCYKCDDEVPIDRSKRLQECIDIIRKQAGLPHGEGGVAAGKKSSGGAIAGAVVDQTVKKTITAKTTSTGMCQKIKGLSNLGNTCFFNAVMQSLTQTQNLESLLVEKSKKGKTVSLSSKHYSDSDDSSEDDSDRDLPPFKVLPSLDIVLPEAGMLTESLITFLHEMNNSTSKSSTVNPSALFTLICKKNQRFRGFQQQDSHELLRYLMDNMRTEEIKRGQTAILKTFKLSENVNPKKVDECTRTKIKEYGRQVKHTIIDSIFGGHLISTVTCEECKYVSQIFEPFLDLSLPVAEEKPQRPNQILGGRKKESVSSEPVEESKPIGVDGFAYKGDKISKNSIKKQKQQKKKNSKKSKKNKVVPLATAADGGAVGGDVEVEGEEEDEKSQGKETKEGEENEEGQSSNKEDCSDADIEDNLDSDMSRCNTFADLSGSLTVPPNLDTITQNDEDGDEIEDSSSCTVTETSSSTTLKQGSGEMKSSFEATVVINGMDVVKGNSSGSMTNSVGSTGSGVFQNGNVSAEFTIVCNGSDLESCDTASKLENNTVEVKNSAICNGNVELKEIGGGINGDSKDGQDCSIGHQKIVDGVQENNSAVEAIVSGIDGRCNGEYSEDIKENGLDRDSSTVQNHASNLDEVELQEKLGNLSLNDSKDSQHEHFTSCRTEYSITQDDFRAVSVDPENDSNTSKPGSAGSQRKSSPHVSRQNSKHSKSKQDLKKEAKSRSKVTLGPRYVPSSRECTIMSCLHQFTSAELLTGNNKFGCSNCTKLKYKQTPTKEKKETVYSNAAKQYLIQVPPAVLTLHLKRFEQVGFSSRKVNRHVDFPFVLDLAPFCSSLCQGVKQGQRRILYSLYGVVEHSGRLNAGHYTAYVKVRPQIGTTSNFLHFTPPTSQDCLLRYLEMLNNELVTESEESEETLEEKLVPPGRWYHISDSRVSEATDSAVQRAQAYLLFYERIY